MPKIKNFKKLAVSESRKNILEIAEAGLLAIDTKKAILSGVRMEKGKLLVHNHTFSLVNARKILVIGIGKCSLEAAGALERILGDKITGGIVLDVHEGKLKKIKTYTGDHPLPTPRNIDATKKIIKLLSSLTEQDLVIFIISGGGSTLLCQPKDFTCFDESSVVDSLIHSGAEIHEINTVRKHLSLARGGYLAKYAYPARVVSLIFSDVVGNNLEFIASGPTVKDTTTLEQASEIIKKYKVQENCGFSHLKLIETPKGKRYFERVRNILFISNQTALEAMSEKAQEMGYMPKIVKNDLTGEAREIAKEIVEELSKVPTSLESRIPRSYQGSSTLSGLDDQVVGKNPGTVLLYGGETTVIVKGKGKGGRNQELTLSALRYIRNGQVLLAVSSDGKDNSDHAGAVCDIITKEKAEKDSLDVEKYLKDNNSYKFFEKTGDYLKTGDTGSNVADIIIAMNN